MTMTSTKLRCTLIAFLASTLILVDRVSWISAQGGSSVTINGSQLNQVMDGFGVSINVNAWNGGELKPALDRLVDEMGSSIFRVYIDNTDWEATNDNADPNTFEWNYYTGVYTTPRLEALWSTLAYLNQKGITSGIVLNFMGPVPAWMGGAHINTASEDEWVEMMASLVYYARVTRGLQFSRVAPLNEPNWDCKEGACVDQFQAPRLLEKLARKFDTLNLSDLRLVAPETASGSANANAYIRELLTNPVAMGRVNLIAYHSYAGDSAGTDALIKGSPYADRRWWISEQMLGNVTQFDWIGFLMTHLRDGASATLAFKGYDNQDNHHVPPEDFDLGLLALNSSTRTYSPRKAFYAMANFCKFVRPGARRIGATSSSGTLQVAAFHGTAPSRVTIILYNTQFGGGGTFTGSLSGLPTVSRFEAYTTDTLSINFQRGADVVVNGGTFSVPVPGASVVTLTASLAADAAPPAVSITAPQSGATVAGAVTITASASDDVGVTGVRFLVDGSAVGMEDTTAPYSVVWNTQGLSTWGRFQAPRGPLPDGSAGRCRLMA